MCLLRKRFFWDPYALTIRLIGTVCTELLDVSTGGIGSGLGTGATVIDAAATFAGFVSALCFGVCD